MKGLFQAYRRGSESPTDMTELFFSLLFIAIGLSLLFIPASCKKNADKEKTLEDVFYLDMSRDLLFLMLEPEGDMTVVDQIVYGEYDQARLEKAKKTVKVRLDEKNRALPYVQIEVNGQKKLFDEGTTVLLGYSKKVLPLTMYLPSLDGSLITVEAKVAYADNYHPESKNWVYS